MSILKRRKSSMNDLPKAVDLDEPRPHITLLAPPKFEDVIASVEEELAQYRPKQAVEPMPEYVEPREGVPPVGALSAEAIVKDFEKTAKGIEAMAAELMDASNRCAEELIALTSKYKELSDGINQVVQHVKDTAGSYRDEAKSVFVRIEDTTIRMKEVRELSDTMRQRLAESAGHRG